VKSAATGRGLDRVFITGVAPLALSDMSSGYNVAKSIYLLSRFQELCGFTEMEIRRALTAVVADCGQPAEAAETALAQMRLYYNGYCFSDTQQERIYNPTLALYFLDHFQQECQPSSEMLDGNLAMDRGKLAYIGALPGGAGMIVNALEDQPSLSVPVLADRFGVQDVLTGAKDARFMASLLYFRRADVGRAHRVSGITIANSKPGHSGAVCRAAAGAAAARGRGSTGSPARGAIASAKRRPSALVRVHGTAIFQGLLESRLYARERINAQDRFPDAALQRSALFHGIGTSGGTPPR
jgi:Predicted AAA-ATPase